MELTRRRQRSSSAFWKIFPRPLPDSMALDILYLIELLFLQDFVIPQIFAHTLYIDLLTPWLIIVFVFRPSMRMLMVGLCATVLLETHSGLPRGLFACLYWMMGVFLYYVRQHLSWASFLPWAVMFCLGQVLVHSLEQLTYWTQNFNPYLFTYTSILRSVANSILSCGFGLMVIYKSRLDTLEEQRLARR